MQLFIVIVSIMILFVWLTPDQAKHQPIPEQYPIKYPLEPMFENYISIAEEIKRASNQKEIYACYVRYILFASCYEDADSFISELYEFYSEKEAQLV